MFCPLSPIGEGERNKKLPIHMEDTADPLLAENSAGIQVLLSSHHTKCFHTFHYYHQIDYYMQEVSLTTPETSNTANTTRIPQ